MSQQLLAHKLPELIDWVGRTLTLHRSAARSVHSFAFPRLGAYYSPEMLASAKAVVVTQVPMPPLSAMGLSGLADFEQMAPDGITYLDTFFVRAPFERDESLFFHELVHIAQWRYLGPQKFLMAYALGHLQSGGYRTNPFEMMAYQLQADFESRSSSFDVVTRVHEQLDTIATALLGNTQ